MGACDFFVKGRGETAKEAFESARDKARWEHGNGGYTGTIAEKHTFVRIYPPQGVDPVAYAEELMDDDDERISDKWGPAGCIDCGDGSYLFFGFASS